MRPKYPVGVRLADPVPVHVGQEIELAVGPEPLVDGLAPVRRDGGAPGLVVRGVGGWLGVILAAQVAVLGIRTCSKGE